MAELKEFFEMVTKQTEPDLDPWKEQERRQRRAARQRRLGAFGVAAVIAIGAAIVTVSTVPNGRVPAPPTVKPVDATAVARDFLEAYGSLDAERAITYLAGDAVISELASVVQPSGGRVDWSGNRRQFRLAISMLEAQGYEQMLGSCEESEGLFAGNVRCTFDFHLLGSDRIGRGPFHGSAFNLKVRDGKIVEFDSFMETERFQPEMWEPFMRWVFETFPEDAAAMYTFDYSHEPVERVRFHPWLMERLSEESIRFWDQHVRDYVKAEKPAITPPVETGSDLYVVDPATGVATSLLVARGEQTNPERSPDGTRVVYESKVAGSPSQIFVREADGTQRQLTTLERGAQDPTWSPDGRQIAFAGRGSDADIFVMNWPDGTSIRRLAGTPTRDSHPDWSPDGSRIVFQSRPIDYFCCERFDIWVASVRDGTLTRLRLTFLPYGASPAWSPDGRWIAITVSSGGSSGAGEYPFAFLRLVRPDGTQPHRLGSVSPDGHKRRNPSWSPDGRSIVFEDQNDICIIDIETGEDSVRCLDEGVPKSPSWDTDGILVSMQG